MVSLCLFVCFKKHILWVIGKWRPNRNNELTIKVSGNGYVSCNLTCNTSVEFLFGSQDNDLYELLNTPFTKTWCWICNQLEVGFFIDISYWSKIQPMQMRNLVFNHKINKINILHDQSLTLKQPQIETIYIFICCSEYFIDNNINCGYMAFQSFDCERTWWRLFQKQVVCTKCHTYVVITITVSKPLLVDY